MIILIQLEHNSYLAKLKSNFCNETRNFRHRTKLFIPESDTLTQLLKYKSSVGTKMYREKSREMSCKYLKPFKI